MEAILTRLKRIFVIKFTFDVFDRFGRDNGGLLAAGLAFFLVLAFVPLLLVGLWALGLIFSHKPDDALTHIRSLLTTQILPGAAGKEVTRLMWRAGISADDQGLHAGPTLLRLLTGHGVAGIIGLAGVVWASIQIFINGSTAMNAAWQAKEKRNWFQLRGVALALLVGTGVLLVLSLVATALSTRFSASPEAKLFPLEGALIAGVIELGAVVVSGLMYAVTYKFLPSADVSWRAALVGGGAAAVAFEIAKKGLSVYLLKPNTSLYGELGNLIVFILWVYYSMMILLLGAEVSAVYATEVESARSTRLKRGGPGSPSAEASVSSSSPLARAKQRDRAQRIRKTGQKEGESARRR